MKITILNDNLASGICEAAHGLSFLIEADKKILFDVGPSDIAFRNAKKLNVSIDDIDFIVLSHGHWDHGNGLKYLDKGQLVAHREIFRKRYKSANGQSIGIDLSRKDIESKFSLTLTKKPFKISDQIIFLGEIPIKHPWDKGTEGFVLKDSSRDTLPDDSGLVIETNQGLIIVSGCAHSGITNIIAYAVTLFPKKRIKAVIGGFHLKPFDDRIERTINYIKTTNIQTIFPSHCTSVEAICEMRKELDVRFVRTGNVFHF